MGPPRGAWLILLALVLWPLSPGQRMALDEVPHRPAPAVHPRGHHPSLPGPAPRGQVSPRDRDCRHHRGEDDRGLPFRTRCDVLLLELGYGLYNV